MSEVMDESLGFFTAACGAQFQVLDADGVLDQPMTATRLRRHTSQCEACEDINEPASAEDEALPPVP